MLGPKPVNWLAADTTFSISFVVVHLLYIFIWLTDIFQLPVTDIWYFRNANCPHTVCSTLAMCAGSLAAFNIGYLILPYKLRMEPMKAVMPWQRLGKLLVRISCGLLILFVILVGPQFLSGRYEGSTFSYLPNIVFQVFQGLILAAIAVLVVSRASYSGRSKRIIWLDTFLAVAASVALLLHGDRSTFLIIVLAILTAYSEFIKPIKVQTAALALAAMFVLLGISGLARHAVEGRNLASFYRIGQEKFGDSLENAAVGFSGSVLTAFVAVDHVPGDHRYYMGKQKINAVAGLIPFGRKLFNVQQTTETSSSVLFTYLIQGTTGKVSGTGTSIFADIYLEGGYGLTLFVFFLFGLLFKHITTKARSTDDLRWKVALVSLVAILSISGRMQIVDLLVRQVAYPVMYMLFFAYVLGVHRRGSRYVMMKPPT